MTIVAGSRTGVAGEQLDPTVLALLRERVSAQILTSSDSAYDEARHVWNGMIDRRPAAIVRCASEQDVVDVVRFAAEQGLPVAVRGGGHSAAGLAVCDGGLVIDLTGMRDIAVDPANRTARAAGGATWGELDKQTQAHGLATTGGVVSTTGIAGLTLGGGLGYLMRSYGLASDNIISARIVTATGEIVSCSEQAHADLFWALHGGGGNFGVVTELEFRLHPVSTVLGGMLLYPGHMAREIVTFYREFTATAPDELGLFCGLLTAPDGNPVVGVIVCYNGPPEDGERVIAPLRAFATPVAGEVGAMPYAVLQTILDEGFGPGLHVYWRSHFLKSFTDDALERIITSYESITSPLSTIVLEHVGGAVGRVADEATAFNHRASEYNVAIIGRWADPAMATDAIAWTRGLWQDLEPHASGVYVNYIGVDEGADRLTAAYGADKYPRLVEVKRRYDPTNMFRYNQNILPGN